MEVATVLIVMRHQHGRFCFWYSAVRAATALYVEVARSIEGMTLAHGHDAT
jgi:hypothetical protein